MGMGFGHSFFGGFGLIFLLVYVAVVAYALYLLTRIADSLKTIAISLERMSAGKPPPDDK
jgi:hypothetical protein